MRKWTNDSELRRDIFNHLERYLHDKMDVEYTNINAYNSPKDDYGFDSIELTDLSVEISHWYGVDVDNDALEGKLADIVEDIIEKVN